MLSLVASALLVAPPSVPPIGRVFGVRNNVDTVEMLERRIGRGFASVGGHPRSARSWQDPKQGWIIWTDGFEHAQNGRYIEGIQLLALDEKSPLPIARHPSYGLLAQIRPGMDRQGVKKALRGQGGAWRGNVFSQTGRARITHLTNDEVENFTRWVAEFRFDRDRLVQIDLRAE
ncbi:MAG: hypothetical protein ACO1SV_22505 [Fimbriimonas sp.]